MLRTISIPNSRSRHVQVHRLSASKICGKLSLKGVELIADDIVVGRLDKSNDADWHIDIGPFDWLDFYDKLAAPAPFIFTEKSHKNAFMLPRRSNPAVHTIRDSLNAGAPVGLPNTWFWRLADGKVAIIELLNGGEIIQLPKNTNEADTE
jgi:hypothetical protein